MTIIDSCRAVARERSTLSHIAWPAAAASVIVGGVAWVAARNPYDSTTFPPCTFHAATGWYCPGCGGTRALYSLLHGDVIQALHMNAFTTLLFLPPVLVAVGWWFAAGLGVVRRSVAVKPWMAWTYAGAVGLFWVLRNLPGFEFMRP